MSVRDSAPKTKDGNEQITQGRRNATYGRIFDRKRERIRLLTSTVEERMHDKTIATEVGLLGAIPPGVKVRGDLAFLGVEQEYPELSLIIPEKKPRGKELELIDLESNREKSRERIIEEAIGGVRRLRAVSEVFRNKREQGRMSWLR